MNRSGVFAVIVGLILSVLIFQNCGDNFSSSQRALGGQYRLIDLYPYKTEAPDFFEDIQLVSFSHDPESNLYVYQFIASVVDIEDEEQVLDVEVLIRDTDGNLVCPRVTQQVNRSSNHIEVPDCETERVLTQIEAYLRVARPGQEFQDLRVHNLDLRALLIPN
jgi:hypothetical protein